MVHISLPEQVLGWFPLGKGYHSGSEDDEAQEYSKVTAMTLSKMASLMRCAALYIYASTVTTVQS